ncbi:MAG TPA: hypothetical protein VE956_05555 [Nodularia sp. (in: cyanobacteria)]|nr:hypothetical protein [Nodularia sp. (in: cyanobacteria)]
MQTDLNDYDYSAIRPEYLPYLKLNALKGRPIPLHTFHDGNRWHLWIPLENGLLQPIRVHDCVETIYLAPKPVRISDAYFRFFDFIYKHVESKHTNSFIAALTSDVFNLGASLKKLDLLRTFENFEGKSRLVSTELEYLLVLCRSMFDLLQEISKRIWDTIELLDTSIKKQKLPDSFGKVVLYQNSIQSPQDIQKRFGLPLSLAEWYSECYPFFCKLKKVRDAIVHQPIQQPLIYINDKGFSIGVDSSPLPFREMMQWPEHILENGRIGSLNYFVAYFIHETLDACEKFVVAITREIHFAPDFAPDFAFFMRSPSMASLLGIRRVLDADPWAEFTLSENFLAEQYASEDT